MYAEAAQWDASPIAFDLLEASVACATQAIVWGRNYYPLPPSRSWLSLDQDDAPSHDGDSSSRTNLERPSKAFDEDRNHDGKREHPTQKPLRLFRWCLGLAPGAVSVIDPFMGSGTTLRAAKDAGLRAVGIDRVERYCEMGPPPRARGTLRMSTIIAELVDRLALPPDGVDLRAELDALQSARVSQALAQAGGDLAAAARLLRMSRLDLMRLEARLSEPATGRRRFEPLSPPPHHRNFRASRPVLGTSSRPRRFADSPPMATPSGRSPGGSGAIRSSSRKCSGIRPQRRCAGSTARGGR